MEFPACPKCKSINTYPLDEDFICPDCNHEWPQVATNFRSLVEVGILKN